jgi:hypothetical protein
MPVSIVTSPASSRIRRSIVMSNIRASVPLRRMKLRSANVAHTPSTPPAVAISVDSVSRSETSHPRLACGLLVEPHRHEATPGHSDVVAHVMEHG